MNSFCFLEHTHTHIRALLNRQSNNRRPLSHSIFRCEHVPPSRRRAGKKVKEWKNERQNGFSIGIFYSNVEKLATESRFLVFDFCSTVSTHCRRRNVRLIFLNLNYSNSSLACVGAINLSTIKSFVFFTCLV